MTIKSGLGLTAAGVSFVLCCIAAGAMALRLVRSNRAALIATLPVMPEQTVSVAAPGEIVLSIEVPRLATEFRNWQFEVTEHSTRRTHSMRYGGPRSTGKVTGISTVKIPLGRLTLGQPDSLTVRVTGVAPNVDALPYHIVLTRPHLARMAVQIILLVLSAVGSLLSLLAALWSLGVLKAS